jgi:hypothetical protein
MMSGLLTAGFSQSSVNFQNYYVNISRPNGGAANNGDTLEIRGVINVLNGTNFTRVRFLGVVPTGTTYIPGSLQAKTNEGVSTVTNTGSYTDAAGDDMAQISGSNVTINLGQSAGVPPANGGSITGGSTIPRFYSSSTIIQATFKVRVTAANGGYITISNNRFTYNTSSTVTLDSIRVHLCPNIACGTFDVTNTLYNEAYGTFQMGTTQNRSASLHVTGFTYQTVSANGPQDGQYAVVKNSSPSQYSGSTPANSDRVFTVWDVFGDHTGTTNSAGNAPVGNGVSGGYFLMVNASYQPSTIFFATVSGLMPNSLYTLRFWIRNICGRCAADPTIDGPMFPPAPGVKPALAYSIDDIDYYTSGDISYGTEWVQKSFTFTTGTATSITFKIRNNAPGGGGNDWALDDLSLHQCLMLLPGQVSDIKAEQVIGKNLISWEANEESQTEYYVVEYSYNNQNFSTAGTVTSRKYGGKYNYSDFRPVNGKIYYRLKTVSLNGKSSFSKIAIIRESGLNEQSLKVSPNPVTGTPKFVVNSNQTQEATVKLLNMAGKTIETMKLKVSKGQNQICLNGSNFEPGVYMLVVSFADGQIVNEKVVITGR